MRRAPALIAIAIVVAGYFAFASGGDFRFRHGTSEPSLYVRLAEGFRHGHLQFVTAPPPALLALRDPYDPKLRSGIDYIWDASLYNGRYYLYHSPMPVLLFYLPIRALFGRYPSDAFVAALCASWLFLASAAAVRRLLGDSPPKVPLPLWLLFVGFANTIVFALFEVRVYEVAILITSAFVMMWLTALLRFVDTRSPSAAALSGFWLGVAVTSRPPYAILLPIALLTALTREDRRATLRTLGAMAAPLAAVAVLAGWYNRARFGNPLELGLSWQLTAMSLTHTPGCSLACAGDVVRFASLLQHYLLWPPHLGSEFPWITARLGHLRGPGLFPTRPEEVIGVLPLMPLASVATIGAFAPATRGARVALAAGWWVLLALCTCRFVVTRYEIDFLPLLGVGTAVVLERLLASDARRRRWVRGAVAGLAVWSIAVGILIGIPSRDVSSDLLTPAALRATATRRSR